MKHTVCPHCGKKMVDPDYSTRFRCEFCKQFLDDWKKDLHEKLKAAMPERIKK